ncbi:hypothetical protein [Bacillus sp. FJAT-45350]|uniref:hypothetical protein n=1 Tax=Bacillus sp. FJAT-45350 TaxID=2011014 RepID=UPI000BB77F68|nr:hypothetical protein [Bacillus sp. FJAT-45350]
MYNFIDQIQSISKKITHNISDLFHHSEEHQEKREISFNELSHLIIANKNTRHTKQILLGLQFNTYQLSFGPVMFMLETKGANDEQLLKVDIFLNGQSALSYKGYEHENIQTDTTLIPEVLYNQLKPTVSNNTVH